MDQDGKELALAVNFAKAPLALQAAAQAHYANLKKIENLKAVLIAKNKELEAVELASGETAKVLRKELAAWDPLAVAPVV
jgi:hypothetical protein